MGHMLADSRLATASNVAASSSCCCCYFGVSQKKGTFSGGLNNDDSSFAGPTLGSHYLGKLPFIGGHQARCTRSCLLNLLDSCFYYKEFVLSCCLGELFFSANHMFLK